MSERRNKERFVEHVHSRQPSKTIVNKPMDFCVGSFAAWTGLIFRKRFIESTFITVNPQWEPAHFANWIAIESMIEPVSWHIYGMHSTMIHRRTINANPPNGSVLCLSQYAGCIDSSPFFEIFLLLLLLSRVLSSVCFIFGSARLVRQFSGKATTARLWDFCQKQSFVLLFLRNVYVCVCVCFVWVTSVCMYVWLRYPFLFTFRIKSVPLNLKHNGFDICICTYLYLNRVTGDVRQQDMKQKHFMNFWNGSGSERTRITWEMCLRAVVHGSKHRVRCLSRIPMAHIAMQGVFHDALHALRIRQADNVST